MTININLEARQQIAAFDQHARFSKYYNKETSTFNLSFETILNFSHDLYQKIVSEPLVYLTVLQQYVQDTINLKAQLVLNGDPIGARTTIPRDLSATQLCQCFKVLGIITKTTQPNPSLQKLISYDPEAKQHVESRFEDPFTTLNPQLFQQFIQRDDSQERQYGLSDFATVQRAIMQDCPEHVPQGRIPKSILIVLKQQLVDQCKSGDRVEVVGVLLPAPNAGPRDAKNQQIQMYLLAFSVRILTKTQLIKKNILQEEFQSFLRQCQELAPQGRSPSQPALELLAASLSPSIYGHSLIKKAVILQLLGGVSRLAASTQIRGDINILLIGAPGCGKSQLLRAALNLSPVAMSASGRGSSGAGLTAAVIIEKSGSRTLQAGAFVLADGGLLCIDEFDKLQAYDRVAIHEAMEQQTISISKAGIHATLNARCAVLAAANYVFGAFDGDKSVAENINLPDSLLSRFDLVFLVNDNQDRDVQIASHVIQNHILSEPYNIEIQNLSQQKQSQSSQKQSKDVHLFSDIPIDQFLIYNQDQHKDLYQNFTQMISQQISKPQRFLLSSTFLNQLITFCRQQSDQRPYLTPEAVTAVAEFYSRLRRSESRGLLVTARALDAMVRLATALARLSFPVRDVCREDVVEAYVLVRHSLFGESEAEVRRTVEQMSKSVIQKRVEKHVKENDQKLDELQQARYDVFIQLFSEIIEKLGGNSVQVDVLLVEMNKYMADLRGAGQALFTQQEINGYITRMCANIDGIMMEDDVIYF